MDLIRSLDAMITALGCFTRLSRFSVLSMIRVRMKDTKENAEGRTSILEGGLIEGVLGVLGVLYRESSFQIESR